MRIIAFISLMVLGIQAHADYFICEIRVNDSYTTAYAEYRGRQTEAVLDGYTCSGKMTDRTVTVQISSSWYGTVAQNKGELSAETQFQDYSYKGEPLDLVKCTCGIN